jgi:hypothetical protein
MSEDQSTFDDLMHSPLDSAGDDTPLTPARAPWSLVAAVAVGALAVVAGYLATSDDTAEPTEIEPTAAVAVTTQSPASTTAVASLESDVELPAGYVEITEMAGIKPEYMIDTGEQLIIAFTTATRRGFEGSGGFQGGDWILETADGQELAASGIVTSVAVPGSFSVQFAKDGDVVPQRIRLLNRWELDFRDVSVELAFSGVPLEVTGTVADLGGGVTVTLDRVLLNDLDGEVAWSLSGAGELGGSVQLFVVVQGQLAPTAFYVPSDEGFNPFGVTELGDFATEGVLALRRLDPGGEVDGESIDVDISVALVGTLPADAEFDLQEIPGLDR